ncbi:hypothetical protein [Pseudomonas viridiflava]|uniref:hypothetical protein n=2 Tax=Pseudomonas viridiflava TaxID=33069 RepID=UPI00106FF7C7|nr:hypothetical protein [Pseudomonas viridiflava]MEE4225622.1 hypothetical protein [Pseudomonas viridiflava]QXG36216.1 hypothetical protein KTT61_03090 [Pseudomonas viridiflava]QXG39360.1 hypothetical protein KTT55_18550 [Pseudomonas viridiflava]
MSDVSNQSVLDELNELVPVYMRSILSRAINEDDFNFDKEGMILTGEINPSSSVVKTSVIRRGDSVWFRIQDEIFDCICTASSEYKDVRKRARDIIVFVTGVLCVKLNLAAPAISGIIALAVLSVIKLSKNIWCKVQGDKRKPSPQPEV